MNSAFWYGRRVFLTGHTGFKGSWLSLWLQLLGAEVTGYSLEPPTNPSLFGSADISKGMNSIIGDVRDFEHLSGALRASRAEVVINMAAQALVQYSYKNPIETYQTNVMGTVNLLEVIRQSGNVRAVVNVTTDKCYENREWCWSYRENDALGGHDPYSSSKACSELVSAAYRQSFFSEESYPEHGVAIATARAGNVIGGGDWGRNRLIPDVLNAFASGVPVEIRQPLAIRPWQHVLEPLRGYLMLAEKLYEFGPEYAGAWNFGPTEQGSRTVQWVVEKMAERWEGALWRLDEERRPHEAKLLKLDISKARSDLGWHPILDLSESLDLVTTWTHQYNQGADAREITLTQIRDFQNASYIKKNED